MDDVLGLLQSLGLKFGPIVGIVGVTQGFKAFYMKVRRKKAEPLGILFVPMVLGLGFSIAISWGSSMTTLIEQGMSYAGVSVLAYLIVKNLLKKKAGV